MHKSYEHRLDHNHAAPSVPISATFISTIGKIYLWAIRAVTLVLNRPVCLHNAAAIIYRNILLGENSFNLIRTRTHEKILLDFFRADPVYVLYITGKNVKNCNAQTHARIFCLDFSLHLDEVSKEQLLKLAWTNQIL